MQDLCNAVYKDLLAELGRLHLEGKLTLKDQIRIESQIALLNSLVPKLLEKEAKHE